MTQVVTNTGSKRSPWGRLWQVPLLIIGLVAFGYGVKTLSRSVKHVPFETHVGDVTALLEAKQYEKAIAHINTLANHFKEPVQDGTMHALAGDAYFLWQSEQPGVLRENFEQAIEHYRQATLLGVKETPVMNHRWGKSALAIGDFKTAAERYEKVIAVEPAELAEHAPDMVTAYLALKETRKALHLVEDIAARGDKVEIGTRVWALCKRIELGLANGGADGAVKEAKALAPKVTERNPAAQLLAWVGRAEFEKGQLDQAYESLTAARGKFVVHNLEDGRAAFLLGKIAQSRGDLATARNLYQEVVLTHAGTSLYAAARLGRAEIASISGDDRELMADDYRFAAREVANKTARKNAPEMLAVDQVRASLQLAYQRAATANQHELALTFLELTKELKEPESSATAFRFASTREKLAIETLEAALQKGDESLRKRALGLYAEAAEDYLRHSKLATLNDASSGASLWRAAQLFDQAGQTEKAIAAYEKFVVQRPRDPRTPEGLLAIGQLYQSIGQLDKAIATYQRNARENPRTPAAYQSTVALARCYMAKDEKNFEQAEKALLSLVQDNVDVLPTAREFRISLFTLGELYYRHRRWADAILRLEESITRYPDDRAVPRATFMLAESYRRSARDIADAVAKDPGIDRRDALEKAKADRLRRAAGLFTSVINLLDKDPNEPLQLSALDEEYLRTAYMNRAECYYDLGEYAAAIKQYDGVATRFAQSISAVEAYIQIVNSYLALREPTQAAAAAERARWLLKRVPDDEFGKGPLALSRQYYEDFFKLTKAP